MEGDGILAEIARAPGFMHDELLGVAHALEWVSDGIDLVAIAIMLVGGARFILGFAAKHLVKIVKSLRGTEPGWIENAGHFVQEDAGEEVAADVLKFLAANALRSSSKSA